MVVFNTVTEVMVAQRSGGVSIFVETLKIWQNMTWATRSVFRAGSALDLPKVLFKLNYSKIL